MKNVFLYIIVILLVLVGFSIMDLSFITNHFKSGEDTEERIFINTMMRDFASEFNKIKKENSNSLEAFNAEILTTAKTGKEIYYNSKLINADGSLSIFSKLNGKHPYKGEFIFIGTLKDGRPKKYNPTTPLIAEYYSGNGDGFIAVCLTNGSVELYQKHDQLTMQRIKQILVDDGNKKIDVNVDYKDKTTYGGTDK